MSNQNSEKQRLRKQIRTLVADLTDHEKKQESEQLIEKVAHFVRAAPRIKTIASYAATPSEINLDALHSALPDLNFCYPVCGEQGQMEFHHIRDISEMKSLKYGIREPDKFLHQQINPADIDLILCPAYAYTQDGERLGKGGGYYDRYLLRKRTDAVTIGVIFSCQLVAHVPTEPHDLIVDRVF